MESMVIDCPTLSGGARILVTGILVALIFLRLFQ